MAAHRFSQKQCHEQTAQHINSSHLQVCRVNPGEKGKYIKIILSLLQSTSSAVVYECAVTLVSLSQAPTAIRAAANCYCQLLVSQSDNNVKLIVLDRLQVSHAYFLANTARHQNLRKLLTAKRALVLATSVHLFSASFQHPTVRQSCAMVYATLP